MKAIDRFLTKIGWPFAKRFVAGKTIEDGLRVAKELNQKGFGAILNFLGEEVKDKDLAKKNADIYTRLLAEIDSRRLNARISVKPSQLGIKISPQFYRLQLHHIASHAFLYDIPLEIDMEQSDTVEVVISGTLALRQFLPQLKLRQCIAMVFERSINDTYQLNEESIGIRLCKGAYPSILEKKEVRRRLKSTALALSSKYADVEIATHDRKLIYNILSSGKDDNSFCGFQFLLGLEKRLREELKTKGKQVFIYVPFGEHWLPYAKRRWWYIIKKIPSMILDEIEASECKGDNNTKSPPLHYLYLT